MSEFVPRSTACDGEYSHEHLDASTLVADLLSNAEEALDGDPETARQCIAGAAAVLEWIAGRAQRDKGAANGSGLAPWQVRRLKSYIDANLAARINLGNLSEVARLSTSHFSRAFKRSFGMTPYAFVLRRRMQRAQRLMLTTLHSPRLRSSAGSPISPTSLGCSRGPWGQAPTNGVVSGVMGRDTSTCRKRAMLFRPVRQHTASADLPPIR